jgi:hypothetical protein
MIRLGLVAACTALVVPITASPASAVTGTWVDQMLTVVAGPDDGDVSLEVYEDQYGEYTYVTTSPDTVVSGCDHSTGPNGGSSSCLGVAQKLVLDGGPGRADISAYFEAEPTAEITTGADGGSVDAVVGPATVTGHSGPDVVTLWAPTLHAELHAGEDTVAWTNQGGNGLLMLGTGDDSFLVSPAPQLGHATPQAVVEGGAGTDDLTAAGVAIRAYGGPGDDRFHPDASYVDPYEGTDLAPVVKGDMIDGGPGVDTVFLGDRGRTQALRVTLDGRADDGAPGERDDYGKDVENVVVRFVRAVVVGNGLDNRIELLAGGRAYGGRGADVLVGGFVQFGGRGHDVLLGRAGTRALYAADGVRDDVRCASPRTVVRADPQDLVSTSCRHVIRQ